MKIHSWCTVCRLYLKSCQGETALLRARAIRGMTHAQIKGINRCRPGDWGSLRWWPQNGWSIMENPWTSYYIKCMYDLGVPPRILGNHHMVSCNVRCYSKQTILWEQPWQNLEHAPCTASPAHICISYLNILCICGVCLCGAGTCWDTAACRGKTLNPLLPTWRMIHLQLLVPFWTEHSWN